MKERADISILGCGWLGLPLAENLVQQGYRVHGATTTPAKLNLLDQKQIQPFLIDLQPNQADVANLAAFLQAEVLVLTIPPRLRAGEGGQYLLRLQFLREQLLQSPVSKVLFISSTAVYPDLNREVTEEDVVYTLEQDPQNVLLQAEQLFQQQAQWQTTVVRFAGLVGGSRHPGRFMAGKKDLPNAQAPVNLIHLTDCVAILTYIIRHNIWGCTYNACADEHPSREVFYTQAALALGAAPPTFAQTPTGSFKSISSQKLKTDLAYQFLYPNPMEFIHLEY